MRSSKVLMASCLFSVSIAALGLVALGRQSDRIQLGGREFERIELQLNTFTRSTQSEVALDMAEDGAVVAAWDSRRQDFGTYGVFARWVDSSGRPRGPEEQVNIERRSMQMRPAVSLDSEGGAGFAWQSLNQDGEAGAIMGRLTGDERILNARTAGDQSEVAIDRLADGRFIAAWKTIGHDPTQTTIALRLLAADGTPCTDEFLFDPPNGMQDHLPCVASDRLGGFIVAWARMRAEPHSSQIRAQRFDRELRPSGNEIMVSQPGVTAIEPAIAADARGRFAVAWLEYSCSTEYDVMTRTYEANGSARTLPTSVCSDPTGWQSGAAIAMAADGRCLVAWNNSLDGGLDSDVYARLIDAEGRPETSDFRVNAHVEGSQALSAATGVRRVALGEDGRMAFAWHGDSGYGDDSAANLTVIAPRGSGLGHDLAGGLRLGSAYVASLLQSRTPHLEMTALPYIPPTFDASARGPLLDSEPLVLGDRDIGFTAFTNTGWTPPDPHMAAGMNHVMGIVNGGIVVYQKNGTFVWQEDISDAGGFWGEVGATNFVFDPEIIFDPYENRFIAMANERSTDNRSMFLLAISNGSDPSNQTAWHKYRFDVTALGGNDTDSPNLAVDRDAIYITADFFTPGEKHLVYIIDKSSVIDGGSAVTRSVLHTGSQSFGIPVMYTDDAPRMYMIEHFESDPSSTVRLWAINDPLGTPSLTSFTLPVPSYYRPANLRSLGTTVQPLSFDARFWSCMYRDGSLWAAHHVSLSNSPRGTVSRWYEIEMNGWPLSGSNPTLRQSGTVAPANQVYCSFNSISADENGNAVMVFARSSTAEYFSIARVYRFAGDPLGFMNPPEFVKQSASPYGGDRWGDYSAVVADPVESGMFWMHHEYTPGSNSWHTWISGELINPPGSYLSLGGVRISDDSVGQSDGNNDGNPNPSETIEVWVNLRNIGQVAATGLSGELTLVGGQATVLQGNASWGDIPPGGEGESLTPFVFSISEAVPDGEVLPFVLNMTNDLGVQEIDMPLVVVAPSLAYQSHEIDDASHGNGNGIPEPGEVLVLPVRLVNTGGQAAVDIEAGLSSSDPDVVIIDGTGFSSRIDPGTDGALAPPYRIVVPSNAVSGDVLSFDLAITAASGYASVGEFSMRVGSAFFDDVEADLHWTLSSVGDNAASGQWVRVDPNGTYQTGQIPVQPEDDHTPAQGTICFVTGQGTPGGAVGEADVDGGTTTLTTPTLDLTGVTQPSVSYWCWYTNNLGNNGGQDVWLVQISSDGGGSWVDLENTTESHNAWEERSFLVSNYITPTNQVVVRFVASDTGSGSLIEAAVDDFSITGEAGVVAVDDEHAVGFVRLNPAAPNPMGDQTTLSFTLPGRSLVQIRVYRADGGLVRTIVDGTLPSGLHRVVWDGRTPGGEDVPSGIYFIQLSAGDEVRRERLVILR